MCLRLIVVVFLFCTLISGEVKDGSENQPTSRNVVSDGKVLNSTQKASGANDTSFVNSGEGKNKSFVPTKQKPGDTSVIKSDEEIRANGTFGGSWHGSSDDSVNFGAVLRGFYVFLGLSVIVIMYFTVRAIRLGRKKTKLKKYGILASREDLEMTPLGVDDEEEDTTIFDLSSHPKLLLQAE